MRWPWVSRAAFDVRESVIDHATGQVTWLRAALDAERQRCADLTERMVAMKRDHFEEQPKGPTTPAQPMFPAEVAKAIAERSAPNSRERRQLETAALDLVRAGKDAADIANLVLVGEQPDL